MKLFTKKTKDIPGRRQRREDDIRTPAQMPQRQQIFARNRTLTGSTSNALSDHYRPSELHSPRTSAHHLASQRRKIGSVFLMVLGAFAALLFILLQFTARVSVSVSDTSLSKPFNEQTYVAAVNNYLGGHPLSRLRFVLDTKDLQRYLSGVVPEVADVSNVALGAIGETNVTLTLRRPVAGWTINSTQYYVDADGIAFEKNYFANPMVQIIDNSGIALEQGTAVASNRFLGFVGRVVALSKSRGYTVVQAIIPKDTTRQLEIRLKETTTSVKLSVDRTVGEQVEDMTRALDYLKTRGSTPAYIDVRVSGKAFYK
ncbi:hypothetical protein BH10PAT4_BH10PAT4_1280 [soil metagenome]